MISSITFNESYCDIKVSKSIPGLVLFGGISSFGNIYRSTDNGEPSSWEPVLEYTSTYAISSIEQSPVNPAHFVACGIPYSADNTRFYNSYDYGETWEESPVILSGPRTFDLLFSPSVAGRYLCATDDGVYLTEGGTSYTRVLEGSCNDLEYDTDYPDLIFASCDDSGIFVSEDDGNSWEPLPSLYRDDIEVKTLEIVGNNWLYAGTHDMGLFRIPLNSQGFHESGSEPSIPLLSVSKSPCAGSVTITVPPLCAPENISVFDVTGRIAYRERIAASASQQNIVVHSLSPGIYFTGVSSSREFCRFVILTR